MKYGLLNDQTLMSNQRRPYNLAFLYPFEWQKLAKKDPNHHWGRGKHSQFILNQLTFEKYATP